jgi:predicted DNA-binding antitoxin AbrB/MazE fold protein
MLSIKATYENGKIKLLEPVEVKEDANVIITFLDEDFQFSSDEDFDSGEVSSLDGDADDAEDKPEEFYESLRAHKRFPAKGDITLVETGEEITFPLNDYSAGGLSFIADRVYEIAQDITAHIKYKIDEEYMLMDFEMVVRGVFSGGEGRYKIGCQFLDQVDEELWHTIMG